MRAGWMRLHELGINAVFSQSGSSSYLIEEELAVGCEEEIYSCETLAAKSLVCSYRSISYYILCFRRKISRNFKIVTGALIYLGGIIDLSVGDYLAYV